MVHILMVCGYLCLLFTVTPKDFDTGVFEWRNYHREQPRMHRGITISVLNYPFYVMIFRNYPGIGRKYLCGGSLITMEVSLTACHCSAEGPTKYTTYIIGGAKDPWIQHEGRQSSFIRHVVHHPLCGKTKERDYPRDYDVGAMILYNPFSNSPYVKPMRLFSTDPYRNLKELRRWVAANMTCLAIGNGMTGSSENATMSPRTKVGRTLALSNEDCMRRMCQMGYTELCNYDFEEHGQLCLSASEAMPCGSDSGGPVLIKGYVVGVVSWTTQCKLGYIYGAANVKGITEVANWFLHPQNTNLTKNITGQTANIEQKIDKTRKTNSSVGASQLWAPYCFLSLTITFQIK